MKYIFKSTDIFDENLDGLFKQKLTSDLKNFIQGKCYKLTVNFDVRLLNDIRFDESHIHEPEDQKQRTRIDIINDLLSYQLRKIKKVMDDSAIEVYSTEIVGDELNDIRTIEFKIEEDLSKSLFHGCGKNKKRMGVSVIMPSRPYISAVGSDIVGKNLSEIYVKIKKLVGNNKRLMSKVLEIEETEDEQRIISAFIEQYGELWLPRGEQTARLLERLEKRLLDVVCEKKENLC